MLLLITETERESGCTLLFITETERVSGCNAIAYYRDRKSEWL